jgi:hypothetical protein
MGDEHAETFYFCPVCQLYMIISYWDNFTGGDETIGVRGLLDNVQGDKRVELIRRCERPGIKNADVTLIENISTILWIEPVAVLLRYNQ